MVFAAFDEASADVLAEAFAPRARLVDADTVNRGPHPRARVPH
jgi:hypothetical protein